MRGFCERELLPLSRALDQEARFPWEVVSKMGPLGYFGIEAPVEYGGAGLDPVGYTIVIEEISRVCAGLGLCVTVHNSVVLHPLLSVGTAEQK